MSNSPQELSRSEWWVEELPFDQVQAYDAELGLYEIDRREETGYDVVSLFKKVGGNVVLLTRVEQNHVPVFDVQTPPDKARDRLHHTFPNAREDDIAIVFPPSEIAA